MKKITLLFTMLVSMVMFSQFNVNDIKYSVTQNVQPPFTCALDGYVGTDTSITVPSSVTTTFNNGTVTQTFAVTSVLPQVFLNSSLTGITLPNTITSIGADAFNNSAITSFIIPDSVITMGRGVFSQGSLASITIGTGLTNIPRDTFIGCELTNVTIPDNITTIERSAFSGNKLANIIIGTGVTSIAANAFAGNGSNGIPSITRITCNGIIAPTLDSAAFALTSASNIDLFIPVGTTAAYTAAGWTGFKSVTEVTKTFVVNDIEYETTGLNTVKALFYNGTAFPVTTLNIPAQVTDSGTTYNVTAIESVAFQSLDIVNLSLPNTLTAIGTAAFFGNKISAVTIPSNVTVLEDNVFRDNDIATLTLPSNLTSIGDRAFNNNKITNLTIPNTVTSIGESAFENNPITTLDLGTDLTSIGTAAFRDNAITGTLTIPNGITSLPDNCFRRNNITSLTLPNRLISIGTACFFDSNLTTLTIPNSVVTIGNNAFDDNNNLTTLTLGTRVETIGTSAFLNDAIATLVIPNSVTTIGVNAFRANGLTEVTFGTAVTSVGANAFAVNNITEIISLSTSPFSNPHSAVGTGNLGNINLRIPFGSRAAYTAAGWTSFKSVIELPDFTVNNVEYGITSTSPNEVTAINHVGIVASPGAFTLPSQVTHNGITYAVTSVAQNAFLNKGITNLTLNEGLREIGTNAFSKNSFQGLVIPNSVTVINDSAFVDNEIRTITFGTDLTFLGTGVFSGTNTPFLNTITNLSLNPIPLPLQGATTDPDFGQRGFIALNIPIGTTARYTAVGWTGFRFVTEVSIPGVFEVNDIVYQVKSGGTNEVTAVFYSGTTSPLVTLNIPSQVTNNGTTYNVTAIANNAFSNLGIVNLSLPNTLTSIGTAAFRDNAIAGALTIPNGVTSLPDNCFRSNNITSLTLPSGLTSIGTACFFDSNLTTLTIPNNVVTIGNNAFDDNNNLTTLTLGTSVETIGASAFLNDAIATLVIPNNVTTIGVNAFRNNSLTQVTLGSGVNVIATDAFEGNVFINNVRSLSTSPATLTFNTRGFSNEGFNRGDIDLLIPTGTTAAYTAAGWTGFKSVTEDATLSSDIIALDDKDLRVVVNENELMVSVSDGIKITGLAIYNLTGNEVLSVNSSSANIDTLAGGVYVLKVKTNKGIVVKKIIK